MKFMLIGAVTAAAGLALGNRALSHWQDRILTKNMAGYPPPTFRVLSYELVLS